jgi:hypothetical protein
VQDARVAARARLEAGPRSSNSFVTTSLSRSRENATRRLASLSLLGERDERLDHAAQLFGLRQRGADGLVTEQRNAHVPQHRMPDAGCCARAGGRKVG